MFVTDTIVLVTFWTVFLLNEKRSELCIQSNSNGQTNVLDATEFIVPWNIIAFFLSSRILIMKIKNLCTNPKINPLQSCAIFFRLNFVIQSRTNLLVFAAPSVWERYMCVLSLHSKEAWWCKAPSKNKRQKICGTWRSELVSMMITLAEILW